MNFELNDPNRIKSALIGIVVMNFIMFTTVLIGEPVRSIFRNIVFYTVFGGLNAVIVSVWAFNYRNDEPSTQKKVAVFMISPFSIVIPLFVAALAAGGRASHHNLPNFSPELFFPFTYLMNLSLCFYWFKNNE